MVSPAVWWLVRFGDGVDARAPTSCARPPSPLGPDRSSDDRARQLVGEGPRGGVEAGYGAVGTVCLVCLPAVALVVLFDMSPYEYCCKALSFRVSETLVSCSYTCIDSNQARSHTPQLPDHSGSRYFVPPRRFIL